MVKPRFFLESLSDPTVRYEILSHHPKSGMTLLKNCKRNVEFQDIIKITDKKELAKLKYKIVKEES